MKVIVTTLLSIIISVLTLSSQTSTSTVEQLPTPPPLSKLFTEWRAFETPPFINGAPDYRRKTFDARHPEFQLLRGQLLAMDTTGWSIPAKIDYTLVWAEMNGYDFNYRILKPWQRDPTFYASIWMDRSDVPAHEGPTHHAITEVWMYDFPLDADAKQRFINDIKVIPELQNQAKGNLTGNARELWIAGIRTIEQESAALDDLMELPGVANDADILSVIKEAKVSTEGFINWLKAEATSKTGPSGIGKENYTWYLQNVHLVPLTWEDEVMILKRELARAWSSLLLEEHRNRELPQLKEVTNQKEYAALAQQASDDLIQFLKEKNIVTVYDYYQPALEKHLGKFVPKERRNFFYITSHLDPKPLFSHFYHWFELARMDLTPHKSEVRKSPLLYNIFDSRNEGLATAAEELFMDAGLYDDNPRSREIVYIMIAQRAARGLGSLYAHANDMTMEEAGAIHSEYTPRGWMKTEKELLLFEQHLYLRQPGYGTSYITGKYLIENTMAAYMKQKSSRREPYSLKAFLDGLNTIGNIPISMGHWELTGERIH